MPLWSKLGLVGFVVSLALLAFAGSSPLASGFSPLAWSPDGEHLAFGILKGSNPNWKLYVVDADGDNLRELVDKEHWLDNEGEELYDFRWDEQSSKVYFEGFEAQRGIAYYVIDIEREKLEQISEAAFLANAPPETASSDGVSTECDAAPRVTTRVTHSNGLIAQSACLDPNPNNFSCQEELQVCDSATGQLLFVLDEHDMQSGIIHWLGIAGIVLFAASCVSFVAGFVLRWRRR